MDHRTISRMIDTFLPRVQKPARYTGGEFNSNPKDWDAPGPGGRARVHLGIAFPDIYDIGMSNLGMQVLYEVVNRDDRFIAERVFAPWFDMEAELRRSSVPLFGLETRHALGQFDVFGFSLAYELDYTNVLNMLNLAHIFLCGRRTVVPNTLSSLPVAATPRTRSQCPISSTPS
jgi:hypothetical protein